MYRGEMVRSVFSVTRCSHKMTNEQDNLFHHWRGNWFSFLDLMRKCHPEKNYSVLVNEKSATEK